MRVCIFCLKIWCKTVSWDDRKTSMGQLTKSDHELLFNHLMIRFLVLLLDVNGYHILRRSSIALSDSYCWCHETVWIPVLSIKMMWNRLMKWLTDVLWGDKQNRIMDQGPIFVSSHDTICDRIMRRETSNGIIFWNHRHETFNVCVRRRCGYSLSGDGMKPPSHELMGRMHVRWLTTVF